MSRPKLDQRISFKPPNGQAVYEGIVTAQLDLSQECAVKAFNQVEISEGLARWRRLLPERIVVPYSAIHGADQERNCCNLHGCYLYRTVGMFKGALPFYRCPHPGCTVGKWGSPHQGSSTPADTETRGHRRQVHETFQAWQADGRVKATNFRFVEKLLEERGGLGRLNSTECLTILGKIPRRLWADYNPSTSLETVAFDEPIPTPPGETAFIDLAPPDFTNWTSNMAVSSQGFGASHVPGSWGNPSQIQQEPEPEGLQPGEGWRFLGIGAHLQAGDEVYLGGYWITIGQQWYGRHSDELLNALSKGARVRRRLYTPAQVPQQAKPVKKKLSPPPYKQKQQPPAPKPIREIEW